MHPGLKISDALTASELRAWARHCGNGRAAARAYAIANALDGLSRAEAARLQSRRAHLACIRPVKAAGQTGCRNSLVSIALRAALRVRP